ncbi:phosphomannomutase [Candidatus Latescibacterota bacterium]
MSDNRLGCFMAYDIRGRVPEDFTADMAYDIGRSYVAEIDPQGAVAVGRDIRDSSEELSQALIKGVNDGGVDTLNIGLCGTEMVYYASSLDGMGGGAMITASHNPIGYNGIKLVKSDAQPISGDTGLMDIERRVRTGDIPPVAPHAGNNTERSVMDAYVARILTFVNPDELKPLTILANPGNGCAGPALNALTSSLPFNIERINFQPDGTFPNGIPNPLLVENRAQTTDALLAAKADFGVAWDGDFDRCFLFDEEGNFIEGYYLVGFLSKRILSRSPGESVVIDPRLTWNSIDILNEAGGKTVISKSGHSFIKEKMRSVNAVYGGEMSAHHYFRDFSYSDSGMIPWLLVAEELSTSGKKLSELVAERIRLYPCSGEINSKVNDPQTVIKKIHDHFSETATSISDLDGVSMEFGTAWRFNIRKSNTEPLVRLNVETRDDEELLKKRTDELLGIIDSY